jgi:ABC-2 type transport system permease protein
MTTAGATRRVPRFGGFSPTFLGLEIRRMLRNRRTIVFTLAVPPVFYLLFGGLSDADRTQSDGLGNVSAYIMITSPCTAP